jgi:hypothetical protein
MTSWPLLNRNKVIDSTVHVPVESCAALENETVKRLAQKVAIWLLLDTSFSYIYQLLDHWNTLPVYNRIPKRQIEVSRDLYHGASFVKFTLESRIP